MTDATERRAYDGSAVVAFAVALAGLVATATLPVLAFPLGVAAIVLALVSRGRVRADDRVRGAGLGLAAFVLGIVEAASVFFLPLLAAVISGFGAIPV